MTVELADATVVVPLSELPGLARTGGLAPSRAAALTVVDLDGVDWSGRLDLGPALTSLDRPHGVVVGSSRRPLPPESAPLLDALSLTFAPHGPGRGWVDGEVAAVRAGVARNPQAATALVQVLAVTSGLPSVAAGLTVESLAYSVLLGGREFAAWRADRPARPPAPAGGDRVLTERDRSALRVTLNRPARHNAFDAAMREGLLDALTVAEADETLTSVHLSAAGRSFSSGGDLDEFGTATDLVHAHLVRVGRSVGHAVHRLRTGVTAVLHGACIGAGIELPAFAGTVLARPGTWFQLPEVAMGLLPGAGGTVSLTRRIGPHRTAYLGLSGARLDLDTALAWGLVDDVT